MDEGPSHNAEFPSRYTLRHLFLAITALAVVFAIYSHIGVQAVPVVSALASFGVLAYAFVTYRSELMVWGLALSVLSVLFCYSTVDLGARGVGGRVAECKNNMKLIALALHLHHDDHNVFPARTAIANGGATPQSWRVALLPYLDQRHIFARYRHDEPWNSPANLTLSTPTPENLYCPSAANWNTLGETQYFAVGGPDTCWPEGQRLRLKDITDGAFHTALLVESHDASVIWSEPRDLDAATMRARPIYAGVTPPPDEGPSSAHAAGRSVTYFSDLNRPHPSGAHMAMADGSVRFVSENTDPEVVKQLINRRDGGPRLGR